MTALWSAWNHALAWSSGALALSSLLEHSLRMSACWFFGESAGLRFLCPSLGIHPYVIDADNSNLSSSDLYLRAQRVDGSEESV